MAIVSLGFDWKVEVIDPGTVEEQAHAEAALLKFVEALARAVAKEDWARFQAERVAAAKLSTVSSDCDETIV